ncbi:choice-of-anchor D domain-containing protein [bacterium]|nr:choice-of-anchor D domain-containing protein [bacterium]
MRNIMLILAVFLCVISTVSGETIITGGEVNGVWRISGSPYIINGDIRIPSGETLIVEPGCTLVFRGFYKLEVDSQATLKALGTADRPIIFTAEDIVLTDSSGGHNGLQFYKSAPGCSLFYCTIEYGNLLGSYPDNYGGGVYCYQSSPYLGRLTVLNCYAVRGGAICCEGGSNPIIESSYLALNYGEDHGGAIFMDHSSPIIAGDTITQNYSPHGGGISCFYSEAMIQNSVIRYNHKEGLRCSQSELTILDNIIDDNLGLGISMGNSRGLIRGNTIEANEKGILCQGYSEPTITNNRIINNFAGTGIGCGIICNDNSAAVISHNIIVGNRSNEDGGGVYCYSSNPQIEANYIAHNYAFSSGGGIYCGSSAPSIINNLIYDNQSIYHGGAICCFRANPLIFNNNITYNDSRKGGAIYCFDGSDPKVINNLFWGNSADTANEIFLEGDPYWSSSAYVAYCDINQSECSSGSESSVINWGGGIFYDDPEFLDTLFNIPEHSPAVNAGTQFIFLGWGDTIWSPSVDYSGYRRPQGRRWDVGAREYIAASMDFSHPVPIVWDSVVTGDTTCMTIFLYSTGIETLNLESLGFLNGTCFGLEHPVVIGALPPGDSLSIPVCFFPEDEGSLADSFIVVSNAFDQETTYVPFKGYAYAPQPVMFIEEPVLDFGTVTCFQETTLSIIIANQGRATLVVYDIQASSLSFVANPNSFEIEPYNSREVNIYFTPFTAGVYHETLWVYSNDDTQFVALHAVALLPPAMELSTYAVDFDSVLVGERSAYSITVANEGDLALIVTRMESNNSAFALSDYTLPEIPGGDSRDFEVYFESEIDGFFEGEIWLYSNADTQGISVQALALNPPILSISPMELDFDSVLIGTPVSRDVELTNSGGFPLHFQRVYTTEPAFSVYDTLSEALPGGESRHVAVWFSGASEGFYSGSIWFISDMDSQDVALQAIALRPPEISLSDTEIFFEEVGLDSTASGFITISNEGGFPLIVDSLKVYPAVFTLRSAAVPHLASGESFELEIIFTPEFVMTYVGSLWVFTEYGTPVVTIYGEGVTAIALKSRNLPEDIGLTVAPNPFNSALSLFYQVSQPGLVTIRIYDVKGNIIAQPVSQELAPGMYQEIWTEPNVPTGVYFILIEASGQSLIRKAVLLK